MIERVAEPAVAGVAHEDDTALATLFGYGRDPCMRAQAVVISFGKGCSSSQPNPRARVSSRRLVSSAGEFEASALARTGVMNSGATLH
jgi:hypothetical protein